MNGLKGSERGPVYLSFWSFFIIFLGTGVVGCETGPATFTVLDRPELQVDVLDMAHMGSSHSHPFNLNEVFLAKILKDIRVNDRDRIFGFGILEKKKGAQAFSDLEIVRMAPALSRAFRLSSPWDVVTFYSLMKDKEENTRITSGGMFITDQRFLHVLVANCRSRPSDTSSSFVDGSELDLRHQPLTTIGRYQFQVTFNPDKVQVIQNSTGISGWPLYVDAGQTLVVDLWRLFPELGEGQPERD